jgi:hypothetical protein
MSVSTEERMKILQMLQDGIITPEEADQLLAAMEEQEERPTGRKPRWLRIKVTDTDTGTPRVNVSLPIALVKAGVKMGARFTPELDRLDPAALEELLFSGGTGHIVDVVDEEDGEHVEIYLD